ncbi:MAG: hypothetical protein CBB61_002830 [Gammaproteobacteria bacterium TMED1]|nr:MAG: hypothetical protein CBB61_002830 [Gammaproteobacteria bacterium TMED1]
MSMIVNTNIASMNAQRSLYASSKEVSTAMERLSTGLKINSAADDAAGFAIAESMTAQVRGLNMAVKNANDGLGLVKVIENASNDVTDMLQRIRELAVQASNGTNSVSDKQNLQNEARALIDEIDRVATTTQYNNENVLDGSFADKKIQVGYNDGDSINFSVRSITSSQLGLGSQTLSQVGELSASTVSTVSSEFAPDYIATVYMTASSVELSQGDVITFGNSASSYIVDSAHEETNNDTGVTEYRVNLYGSLSDEDKVSITTGNTSVSINTSATTSLLDSSGWAVTTGDNGETLVSAEGNAYDSIQAAGGISESDIIVAFEWLEETAIWVPNNIVDNGTSISFAPLNASGTSGPNIDPADLGSGRTLFKASSEALEDVDLVNNASGALNIITTAIDQVGAQKAELGAFQNRLEYTVSNLMNVAEFTAAARSRIQDADFAVEAARLAKTQVLQQTGTAMLAQANAAPQLALQLLR